MSLPVYLIIYHSPIFAAHWALWIPDFEKETAGNTGKIINVQGNPGDGFVHEFERNVDLTEETRSYSLKLLCRIPLDMVVKADGGHAIDNAPIDKIEEAALAIEAPGPSLRPVSSVSSQEIKSLQAD